MLISEFEAENKKNKPRVDNKKRLKNKYGSKYIFCNGLFID
jgi:hypothetical protein